MGDQPCWDAIVVGAGPAGAAAAFVLATAGVRTLVVDRSEQVTFKFGELLPPHASPLLRRMGLDMGKVIERHARARGVVSAWGSARAHEQDFLFNPYGDGARLDRPAFDAELRGQAAEAGATIRRGQRVVDVALSADGAARLVCTSADGAQVLNARHVIDCSGRASVVSRLLNAAPQRMHRLFAYARRFEPQSTSVDRDAFLRIESVADGWLYSLVLPSGERIVVFHTDQDIEASRPTGSRSGLDAALNESTMIGPLLNKNGFVPTGRLRAAAAGSVWRSPVLAPNIIAAGDATLAFDPLASRGMFSALTTGYAAAEAVLGSRDGDHAMFGAYAAQLESDALEYRHSFAETYAAEQRYSHRPFWSRRQTESTTWLAPQALTSFGGVAGS